MFRRSLTFVSSSRRSFASGINNAMYQKNNNNKLLIQTTLIKNSKRCFSATASEEEFQKYVSLSKTLKEDPGNEVKLQMYALFKQATIGTNATPKPGAMDIVGKYKWSAWTNLGTMSKEDARKEYIDLVNKLIKEIGTQ